MKVIFVGCVFKLESISITTHAKWNEFIIPKVTLEHRLQWSQGLIFYFNLKFRVMHILEVH